LIRLSSTLLLGIAVFLAVSCAGAPDEEIQEENVVQLEETSDTAAPDEEMPIQKDEAGSAGEEKTGKSVSSKDSAESVESENSPEGVPAKDDDIESIEKDSEEIVSSDTLDTKTVPENIEPELSASETDFPPVDYAAPAPEPEAAPAPAVAGTDNEPFPINPLLFDDKPFESPVEEETPDAVSPAAAEPTVVPVVTAPAVTEPTVVPIVTAPAIAVDEATPAARESVPLNNPAVSAAAPSRLLDEPGEFTITLEGMGWIFRSDLSTSGSWRFLERDLDGNSTHFRFLFTQTGDWNLVFERQDLSSGGSESEVRNVVVLDTDSGPAIDNGPIPETSDNPISGTMPVDAESRHDAASSAVADGRIAEAMEFWEQDASRDDEAGRKARASLMENAASTGSIGPLVTWLPKYLEDETDAETLAAALDAFEGQAGYDSQSLQVLEELTEVDFGTRRPEWLYRLASYLEKPGPERDLDRSAVLYQEVISSWPLTVWRDLSEERLLWLQRHYFRVR
jgi:hypothetical protein